MLDDNRSDGSLMVVTATLTVISINSEFCSTTSEESSMSVFLNLTLNLTLHCNVEGGGHNTCIHGFA